MKKPDCRAGLMTESPSGGYPQRALIRGWPFVSPLTLPAMNPPVHTRDREQLTLRPPPDLPDPDQHGGAAMTALPMLGSLGSMAVMLSFASTSIGPGGGSRALLAGGVFLVTTLLLVAVQLDRTARARRRRIHYARTSYLLYLAEVRATIREYAASQRQRDSTPDSVRIGHGTGPLDLEIVFSPGSPRADLVVSSAAQRLVDVQSLQPGMPVTIDVSAERRVSLSGEVERARDVARAIICTLASQQPVVVVIDAAPEHLRCWDWVKWLPVGVAGTAPPELSTSAGLEPQRVLLVRDGMRGPAEVPPHVTVLSVQGDSGGRTIDCSSDDCDRLSRAQAEATARRIAQVHDARRPGTPDLMSLLDLPRSMGLDPGLGWTRGEGSGALCAPIGVTREGGTLTVDLKESAAGGVGPHGLIVGATGSGKSELLRTLVLGLALTHSPDRLNLVLVDFKGGATFSGFVDLPHVSALVTNLAQETTLVARMQDALEGEVIRRQSVLRAAGDFASLREYDAARTADRGPPGDGLPPLPSLLIVIDEFTELLAARPEFLDVFVAIGRLGRSLGIHLVLATQRLDEGRLRGLEAHLSYRIALRTFSESESRAAIGAPDAAHLPTTPGAGLLRTGSGALQRFDTAYVSGPRPPAGRRRIEPFVLSGLPSTGLRTSNKLDQHTRRLDKLDQHTRRLDQRAQTSLREVVVASLSGHGTPAHRMWLPPLGPPVALGALLPDLAVDRLHGLTSQVWRSRGPLVVPIGIVDRPRDQRRDALIADLRGAGGHFITVGSSRSGKTTLLQTFVLATALLHTPVEARFFIIDATGGLAVLRDLPHVAGLASAAEPDVVRRILDEVAALIAQRQGRASDDAAFVVIDGWDRLGEIHIDLPVRIHELGARGLSANVHLVVSATRWGDVRIATRELFGTRVELRLGDPLDSEIDRRAATGVPASQPGRGIVAGAWQVLIALPQLHAGDDLAPSVSRIADAWRGPPAPPLRVLPNQVRVSSLPMADLPRLGIRERDLEPVHWNPDTDQHLLAYGDGGSGKTNLLRTLGHEITRIRTPARAQLLVVSPRSSLDREFTDDYLLHALRSPEDIRFQMAELARELSRRAGQFAGPEVFVLVDDYDLVGGVDSPLTPLVPLVFRARDVGLHLLLTRRASGASRALFEPALQALRDLGASGVLLSGNPDEGPLFGSMRPARALPGRAQWVTQDAVEVCQIAWSEPTSSQRT